MAQGSTVADGAEAAEDATLAPRATAAPETTVAGRATNKDDFAAEPGEIILNLITPCEADLKQPGRILFRLDGSAAGKAENALLEYDSSKFAAAVEKIALDDAGLERIWNGRLQRIRLRMPKPAAESAWTLRISIPGR